MTIQHRVIMKKREWWNEKGQEIKDMIGCAIGGMVFAWMVLNALFPNTPLR